jgi:hypothetical protein
MWVVRGANTHAKGVLVISHFQRLVIFTFRDFVAYRPTTFFFRDCSRSKKKKKKKRKVLTADLQEQVSKMARAEKVECASVASFKGTRTVDIQTT